MSKVILTKFKKTEGKTLTADDLIMVNSNKTEYGSIMLVQPSHTLGSFLNPEKKTGFIAGKVEDLQELLKIHKLKAGDDLCETDLGKHRIVVIEKLESEVDKLGEKEKLSYQAKKHSISLDPLTKDGEQIFRMTTLVEDNSELVDIKIQHDTVTKKVEVKDSTAELTA